MDSVLKENAQWINDTWEKVDRKLSKVCIRSREKLPFTTVNGVHDNKMDTNPCWWTNGFWGGMMWLMYQQTNNEEYKKTAIRSEQLLDKALELANVIASKPQVAVRQAKQAIRIGKQIDMSSAIAFEAEAFGLCFSTEDQKDSMRAFLNKEKLTQFKNR